MVKQINRQWRGICYAAILSSFCCSSTCGDKRRCPDGSHDVIDIINNSSMVVNWIADDNPSDSVWTVNGDYPDTDRGLIPFNSSKTIKPGLEGCWEQFYMGGYSQYYFIFNHDTVKTIGWQGINGTNRGLLKRIRVDINYLNSNDFTITYP